jgi:transglutaminase-like putative cysteine protease
MTWQKLPKPSMAIFTIRHITTYRYKRPVAFGEHRMMLRPRDDNDQKVLESGIDITPKPTQLSWTRDAFGNHVATALFAERASELRFESAIRLAHVTTALRVADIEDFARTFPFAYAAADRPALKQFMGPPSPGSKLDRWAATFLRQDGSADTYEVLVNMTHAIKRNLRHVARHEKGVQEPLQTLARASGSCRDHAVLMIAALRSLGLAARFVSGYLHLADGNDDAAAVSGGNTHAWVQTFIPGPGWVDLDPSSGVVGNQNLVRVAVAQAPREAIPLQGTWLGDAADHLTMKVAVKVSAATS